MRKGFDTLCGVVRLHMGRDPLSGEVFILINGTRTTVKMLHWEHICLRILPSFCSGKRSGNSADAHAGSSQIQCSS
jgi:hypothetical protein